MPGEPLFSADNAHAAGSGTPPHVRREPGRYQGYFENRYGEQWVFVFDDTENRGWLRGGSQPRWLPNAFAQGLVADAGEQGFGLPFRPSSPLAPGSPSAPSGPSTGPQEQAGLTVKVVPGAAGQPGQPEPAAVVVLVGS